MKRSLSLLLALLLLFLTACGTIDTPPDGDETTETVELSLYTYPVGNWGDADVVKSLIARFNDLYPQIHVTVTVLDNDTGADYVNTAIESGRTPDLLLATPKCLWDNWGKEDMLQDFSPLWESAAYSTTYASVTDACIAADGSLFVLPVAVMPYCMAINYEMFKAAGALQYINEETRTWSSDDFIRAVAALVKAGYDESGVVCCGGQEGDWGTRALVTNLFGGRFVNETRTGYDADSEENLRALKLLTDMKGVDFDSDIVGSDENLLFLTKKLAMTFYWNVEEDTKATNTDFTVFPMNFPSDATPALPEEIWGLGLFRSGDDDRTEAAQTLARFLTEDDALYRRTVAATTYWPVRPMESIYDDALRTEYGQFVPCIGSYDQIAPGWATARTEWWNMLRRIGNGGDIGLETATFMTNTAAVIGG